MDGQVPSPWSWPRSGSWVIIVYYWALAFCVGIFAQIFNSVAVLENGLREKNNAGYFRIKEIVVSKFFFNFYGYFVDIDLHLSNFLLMVRLQLLKVANCVWFASYLGYFLIVNAVFAFSSCYNFKKVVIDVLILENVLVFFCGLADMPWFRRLIYDKVLEGFVNKQELNWKFLFFLLLWFPCWSLGWAIL